MRFHRRIMVLDAADTTTVGSFWAEVLETQVHGDHEWLSLTTEDGWEMAIQYAPDHQPPQWPDGAAQQIHLDLYVDDMDAAHQHVMAAGARWLQEERAYGDGGFAVYADPAGHPFCLCWGT